MYWGGRLLKGNGGARGALRMVGNHSQSVAKAQRELDCETYKSSRDEESGLVIRWFRMEGPSLNG